MQSMGKHNLTLAISVAAFLLAPGLRAAQQTGTSALVPPPNAVDRLTREVRHELVMQPYYGVFDDQIRRAEYRAIYSRPGLDVYAMRAIPSIHIIVEGAHVTLEGVVASQADKNLAGVAANGVGEIFSVDNNLRVESH